jgi:hypothetical protein
MAKPLLTSGMSGYREKTSRRKIIASCLNNEITRNRYIAAFITEEFL